MVRLRRAGRPAFVVLRSATWRYSRLKICATNSAKHTRNPRGSAGKSPHSPVEGPKRKFSVLARRGQSRFVSGEIKENERAKFGNRQHVGTAIVIHVCNHHLHADSRFTIDQMWFEMGGP